MVASFVAMAVLEGLGLSGQSQVLTGFALVGTLALTFAVTMVAAGLLGVAIERVALRPMRNVRGTAAMITTIGGSYILFNVVLPPLGARPTSSPRRMPVGTREIGGRALPRRRV